ncbi:MAG: quinone oxidoreductase [Rhizobiales bacterium]|nr:quinone oxidoreductase [Hyphomicrobiales bacterium]
MAYAMVAHETGGSNIFKKETIEVPSPKKGEVLIRHTAIGVNFIDVYQRSGLYPAPDGYPAVLGSEAAGVVQGVGTGVTGFRPGDKVAYTTHGGAYATHRVIDAERLVKLPLGFKDEIAAACMLKGLTAHYLIHDSFKVKAGDTVLFHAAAGGVGLIAGQWLKSKGVTAIGTAGSKEKCALARRHGFSKTIDYTKQDFVEEVRKITKGAGVAAVFDSVGKTTYPGSLKCLSPHGTFVSFGQSSGPIEEFKLSDLAQHGSLHATRPTLFHFIAERKELEKRSKILFKAISSGEIKIQVNQTFELSKIKQAHDALESRKTTGQTILIP